MRMIVAVVAFVVCGCVQLAHAVEPPHCPVMTDEIADPEIYTEYEGRKVYFCCQRCRINFQSNPQEYVVHLASVGQVQEVDWSEVDMGTEPDGAAPGMSAPPDQSQPAQLGRGGVLGLYGRSHVVWVHFPIACLVIAGVIRLGALIGMEGTRTGIGASGTLLMIGALGAVVSATSGLVNPQGEAFLAMQGVLHDTFEKHKLLGLILAGLSVAAVMAEVWSVRKSRDGSLGNRQAAHADVAGVPRLPALELLAHELLQLGGRNGFLQHRQIGESSRSHRAHVGETAQDDHRQAAVLALDRCQQVDAVHVGHPEIGDQQVHGLFGQLRHRLLTVPRGMTDPPLAGVAENPLHGRQHVLVIVDQQDGLHEPGPFHLSGHAMD